MTLAAQHARTNKIPFLGICLGLQVAMIEYARNVMGLDDADSTEFCEGCQHPVVLFMPEVSKDYMGGTMRLGKRNTSFVCDDCLAHRLYACSGQLLRGSDGTSAESKLGYVSERHRHRYEVNPEYISRLSSAGIRFVGFGDGNTRAEIIELPRQTHPFFLATQYHPEFKARPTRPSPIFNGLMLAASGQLDRWLSEHK